MVVGRCRDYAGQIRSYKWFCIYQEVMILNLKTRTNPHHVKKTVSKMSTVSVHVLRFIDMGILNENDNTCVLFTKGYFS